MPKSWPPLRTLALIPGCHPTQIRTRAPGGEQEGQMEGLEWQLIKATSTKKAAHLDPHYNQAERRPRAFSLHAQSQASRDL